MPHWRLQPVWLAVLSLHGSAARSRRPMLRLWERRLSIPHSLLFGDGCRGRAGTADEDNYPAVTAEGMAGSDLAARRAYRVRSGDGLRLRGRGDQLSAGDGPALCRCLWSRRSLSGDGHGVVAPPSPRRRAPMMIASEHRRSASGPGSFDHRATLSGSVTSHARPRRPREAGQVAGDASTFSARGGPPRALACPRVALVDHLAQSVVRGPG
jgi:hypothetical protein